ncbi:MAG: hypothetical protein CME62_17325 [Halobacteriovoraceae bacterium]|nr:hypothetical protein [Halobacteriovoraceae bacterium]|tara:strand:- start:4381 stop:4878 length:498 start_codon:yes stop_codon:yes gene_type:complete
MSELISPTEVKYFISCLFNSEDFTLERSQELAATLIGPHKSFHPQFNPLKDYYSQEMGHSLERVIFYSDQLKKRDELVDRKLQATLIENKYSRDNKRLINLDVGYIAKEQVLLATGKPYAHRIFLGEGVFAELTYFFQNKSFQSLPWTYPDYKHQEKIEFFNQIR